MTAIEWLKLGVEQYLRELDDVEYRELIAVARPSVVRGIDQTSASLLRKEL